MVVRGAWLGTRRMSQPLENERGESLERKKQGEARRSRVDGR